LRDWNQSNLPFIIHNEMQNEDKGKNFGSLERKEEEEGANF
jgi:hypothetical protein